MFQNTSIPTGSRYPYSKKRPVKVQVTKSGDRKSVIESFDDQLMNFRSYSLS